MTTVTAHTSTSDGSPAAGGDRAPVDISGDKVPFARLASLEVRKMVDTRSGLWMLIAIGVISFLVCGVLLVWGNGAEDEQFTTFLGLISMPMMLLLPIMGIMSATQEWSQRTGLATFTLVPRRGRIIAAKVVAAVVLTLVLLAVGAVAAALSTVIAGGDFSLEGVSIAGLVLTSLIYTLQGVAFGAAFLNTPIAIVSSLALPTVWTMLSSMIERVRDLAPWLDINQVTAPLMDGTMTGENWGQLATGTLAWVGLPMAIGTWRILTREVK